VILPTRLSAVQVAEDKRLRFHVGNVFSADLFYTPEPEMFEVMRKYSILGVEMEAAGIYTVATELGAEALAICTVSDDIVSGAALTTAERQSTFDEMIQLALDTALLTT
jgi:purine-nucleoside phosphorylase